MKIVKFHKNHIPHIRELSKKFKLPDVTSPLFIVRTSVVDDEGNLVAAGFLKVIGEAILVIDENLLMKDRAKIVDMFHKVGEEAARKKGLDEIDAFVTQDKGFVNFLLKRLDFVESGAEVLVKRL